MPDAQEMPPGHRAGPVLFQPDSEIGQRLSEATSSMEADLHLKLEVTDLREGTLQTVFVRWEDGDIESLVWRIGRAIDDEPAPDAFETYFWLFWRGWSGMLDSGAISNLPAVTPDLISKVEQGVPLRDNDLRRLGAALEWASADASGQLGSKESWTDGTISPGHLKQRKELGKFMRLRMKQLYGSNYESASTDP